LQNFRLTNAWCTTPKHGCNSAGTYGTAGMARWKIKKISVADALKKSLFDVSNRANLNFNILTNHC
jgi:hypothetical protein